MILTRPDPASIILQITVSNLDGTPKTSLTTANVRVYHVSGGSEVDDLSTTPLVQVGSTNTWRYTWEPASLSAGQYFVEYDTIDDDGVQSIQSEELIVEDYAVQTDVAFFRKLATGRWKMDITGNTMIFYDDDGATPLLIFDLKNAFGVPATTSVFERVPRP